ncbi:MAG: GNAT family N-acetyltransferase, partial [Candidatus Brocadiaceae bacterium]
SPETVVSAHVLRKGLCKAYVAGTPENPRAAIVQSDFCAAEPAGFGRNPDLLWDLLTVVEGWDCFLVDSECAPRVAERMQASTGRKVGFIHDVNLQLDCPADRFKDPCVRSLTPHDSALLSAAPPEVSGAGYRSVRDFLAHAIAAAAIVDGGIVSLAYTTARSQRYADVGVHTLAPFRRRGFARSAASMVAARVQEEGQTPVWSTGHFNTASLKIVRDIGFTEFSRRTYVVTDKIENWEFAQQLRSPDGDKLRGDAPPSARQGRLKADGTRSTLRPCSGR